MTNIQKLEQRKDKWQRAVAIFSKYKALSSFKTTAEVALFHTQTALDKAISKEEGIKEDEDIII